MDINIDGMSEGTADDWYEELDGLGFDVDYLYKSRKEEGPGVRLEIYDVSQEDFIDHIEYLIPGWERDGYKVYIY